MKRVISIVLVAVLLTAVFLPSVPNAYAADNEQQIYNYLVGTLGLNTAAACAVLGNIYWETDETFSPTAYNPKEEAWGLCQWENDRLTTLQSMYPNSWKTLSSQLAFLKWELEGGDYKGPLTLNHLKDLSNTKDGASEGAQFFAANFERCDAASYSARMNLAANTFWPKYQHNPVTGYLAKCQQFPSYCTVKVSKNSAPIWTLPCDSSTDGSSKKIETANTGTTYTATRLIYNTKNHYWYRVTSKSGSIGYLYAGNCSYVSKINDLDIANATAPPTLEQYASWPITGTISTTYSELTKVSGYVFPGTNTSGTSETGDTVDASGDSYYLPGSALDKAIKFGVLEPGRHTYVISAKSISYYATSSTARASVTNSKELFSAGFYVRGETPSYNNYLPVGQLTDIHVYDQYISIKGWAYDEDHIDFSLTVYITLNGTKWPYVATAGNLNNDVPIGNKYQGFEKLFGSFDPGVYAVSVYAADVDEFGNSTGNSVLLGSSTLTILPPHTHQYESIVIDPTCTQQGYTIHQCSCGDHYEDTYTDPVDHVYAGYSYIDDPTITSSAQITWYCGNCSHTEIRTMPPLNTSGKYKVVTVQEASCTQIGIKRYYLLEVLSPDFENSIYFTVTTARLPHSYNDAVAAPTCTEQGYTEHTCTVCGASVRDSYTDALGHEYIKGICIRCGALDPTVVKGDLTGDKKITAADAALIARYLANLATLTDAQKAAADINNDGKVNSADAVYIARYLVNYISTLEGIK